MFPVANLLRMDEIRESIKPDPEEYTILRIWFLTTRGQIYSVIMSSMGSMVLTPLQHC